MLEQVEQVVVGTPEKDLDGTRKAGDLPYGRDSTKLDSGPNRQDIHVSLYPCSEVAAADLCRVDRSTISKVIKNNKEKLERQANNIPEDAPVKAPRGGVPRYQTVEDALGDYLDHMIALNSPVTDHVLQERAIAIGMEQNISAFKASPKWISMVGHVASNSHSR